uniref:hypothetical protein n=1 Tax=uncultured Draconibacterium sp. TaxID=1573823 RepID=UPI0032170E01
MNNSSRFEFDHQTRILFKYYYGLISVEAVKDSWTDAIKNKLIPDNVSGFVLDYREASFNFEISRLAEVAEFYVGNIDVFRNKRIAMVVENTKDIVYPILFQNQNKGYVTQTFSTMDAAIGWVLVNSCFQKSDAKELKY